MGNEVATGLLVGQASRAEGGLMGRTSTIYLLHFEPAYHHARHYIGSTDRDVADRVQEHMTGIGSPLIAAAINAGCHLELARTWPGGRKEERRLHLQKNSPRLCPICAERQHGATVS